VAREPIPTDPGALRERLKQVIIEALMLDLKADEIEDQAPLFGSGLGLDSVDALELAVEFERVFGVRIPDDEASRKVFASVDSLAAFFATQAEA
jgi:acyl carrier protein